MQDPNNSNDSEDILDNLEYGRYLKEVVDILEQDPDFKRQLEKASADDIKSGNIAEHLSLVQHHIRSQLDEAKQREMARLRDLVGRKYRNLSDRQRQALSRNGKMKELLPKHVDMQDHDTFSELDLERLIRHASKDLDEIDRRREQEFKYYELRKEYQRRAKLAKLTNEERQRLEKLHLDALEKRKRHPKVNHPGSVDQMEEVWEKVDRLEAEQFTPKSFFKLHDINSDGYLDEGELEAIMLKEAEKIHEGAPEADSVEKQEEMDRMRQHVMKEFDKNNDRMVSFDEFQNGINGTEARNDQGWQSIEDQPVFSEQEFQNFSQKMAPQSTPIPRHQTPTTPTSPPPGVPINPAVQSNVNPQQPMNPPVQPPPQQQQPPNDKPPIPPRQ